MGGSIAQRPGVGASGTPTTNKAPRPPTAEDSIRAARERKAAREAEERARAALDNAADALESTGALPLGDGHLHLLRRAERALADAKAESSKARSAALQQRLEALELELQRRRPLVFALNGKSTRDVCHQLKTEKISCVDIARTISEAAKAEPGRSISAG
jgi:hypothetical protein